MVGEETLHLSVSKSLPAHAQTHRLITCIHFASSLRASKAADHRGETWAAQ